MNMYNIKTDKKLKHHYMFVIILNPLTDGKEAGKLSIRCGPFYFHNKDVISLRNALILSNDELFKTTKKEAITLYNIESLVGNITGMKIVCHCEKGSFHHFSSEVKIDNEYFHDLVKMANYNKTFRTLLNQSKIKC